MDVKGINWVGHIYHKYESMLLEVEEDIYQDVLNQVQTVGDSVKKFYSDVMQDLLPPPSSDSDVCACKKTKVGTKEEPVNVKAGRVMEIPKVIDMRTENRASSFNELSSVNSSSIDSLSGSSSELYSTAYEDANMKNDTEMKHKYGSFEHLHEDHEASYDEMAGNISGCDEIEDQNKYGSFVSVDGPSKGMLGRSIDNKGTEVRLSSCGGVSAEPNDMSSSRKWVSIARSVPNDADISGKEVDKVIASHSGEGDDNDESEINNKNVIDQDPRAIQQDGHLKPKETRVMVNGDEVHFAPPRKGKSRPSKTKIRDTLSLRMKSARTQEYEQLAVWYAGDAGSKSLKPVPSMEEEDTTSSATRYVCESEWELL